MRVSVVGDLNKTSNSWLVANLLEQQGILVTRLRPGLSLPAALALLKNSDVLYGVARGFSWRLFAVARLLGKRCVNHWIGTDVLRAIDGGAGTRQAKLANVFIHRQLTVVQHLSDELAAVGIASQVAPVSPPIADSGLRASMPVQPTMVSYLPDKRAEFYGASIIYRLADAFPQLKFLVVAGTAEIQPVRPNIEYLGFVADMNAVYERAPILIRLTQHDGLPKMVLEALAKGNQVIYRYSFPHCYQAATFEAAATALKQILANGCPINRAGHDYVKTAYNEQTAIKQLLAILSQ